MVHFYQILNRNRERTRKNVFHRSSTLSLHLHEHVLVLSALLCIIHYT